MINLFLPFPYYISPWKREGPFFWINLNPLRPRMHCVKIAWNWPCGSWEEGFKISSMFFRYFVIIFPWKSTGLFIWKNLNSLHPKMLCAKFGWNWSSDSGEEYENVKSLPQRRQRRQRLRPRLRQRQRRQRQRRWTTHKLWSETFTWAFGSGELKRIQMIKCNEVYKSDAHSQNDLPFF